MLRGMFFNVLLLTIAAIALPWLASAETRIALVVGNSAYPSGPLGSPKDDAKAIETKLKVLGFQVTRRIDLGREEFFKVIRSFSEHLKQPGTIGLFYYSGHGMQVNNQNYMIPTDADIRSEEDIELYAVPVKAVLSLMKLGESNPNFVILDACRDNPFEKRFKSSQDGLAPMNAPLGTLIAFAAEPGKRSLAGSGGKLSLYTAALAEHIDQPYQNFLSMFIDVQNNVYKRSGGMQSPHLELSPGLKFPRGSGDIDLSNFVSFKPMPAGAAISPSPPPVPLPEASCLADLPRVSCADTNVGDIDNIMCRLVSSIQFFTEEIERLLELQKLSETEAACLNKLMLKRAELSMLIAQIQSSAHEARKHHIESMRN